MILGPCFDDFNENTPVRQRVRLLGYPQLCDLSELFCIGSREDSASTASSISLVQDGAGSTEPRRKWIALSVSIPTDEHDHIMEHVLTSLNQARGASSLLRPVHTVIHSRALSHHRASLSRLPIVNCLFCATSRQPHVQPSSIARGLAIGSWERGKPTS